jgi:hypothetical protein
MFRVGEKVRIKMGLENYPNVAPGLVPDIINAGGIEAVIAEITESPYASYIRLENRPYAYRDEWLEPVEPNIEINTDGIMELFENG